MLKRYELESIITICTRKAQMKALKEPKTEGESGSETV